MVQIDSGELWGPLAHSMDDLDEGVGGLPLVDHGGCGPKGGGSCLGHHLLDFMHTGVNLMQQSNLVNTFTRTHCLS